MNHSASSSAPYGRELYPLLAGLCDDSLSSDQFLQLDEVLKNDASARRMYFEYLDLHLQLGRTLQPPTVSAHTDGLASVTHSDDAVPLPQSVLALLNDSPAADQAGNEVPATGNSTSVLLRQSHSFFSRPVLTYAALVALCLYGSFALVAWNLRPDKLPSLAAGGSDSVAVVRDTTDVRWSKNVSSKLAKSSVLSGEPLKIESGTMELELKAGAKIVVEGPADWSVDGNNSVSLRAGKLLVHVPGQAVGFSVETPMGKIVDLGTEFGVEVSDDQITEIQVLSGKVQIDQKLPNTAILKTQLFAGQAMRLVPGHRAVAIPADPEKLPRRSIAHQQSDRKTDPQRWEKWRNDPALVALYVCGEQPEHRNRLLNLTENRNNLVGTFMEGTESGDGRWNGPLWIATADRDGYDSTSKALCFNGNQDHVAFESFNFGRQFTFAAWICPSRTQKGAILFNNLDFAHDKSGFYLAIGDPSWPNASGELLFAVHDGEDRRYFARSAPHCIQYQQWQHVALTVDVDEPTARIYCNGIEVAMGKADAAELQIHATGKWNLGCEDIGDISFMGLVDQVMIFQRVLNPQEIADLAN